MLRMWMSVMYVMCNVFLVGEALWILLGEGGLWDSDTVLCPCREQRSNAAWNMMLWWYRIVLAYRSISINVGTFRILRTWEVEGETNFFGWSGWRFWRRSCTWILELSGTTTKSFSSSARHHLPLKLASYLNLKSPSHHATMPPCAKRNCMYICPGISVVHSTDRTG